MAVVEFHRAFRHHDVRLGFIADIEVDWILHADAVGVDQAAHERFVDSVHDAGVNRAHRRHLPHFSVDEFEAGIVGKEAFPSQPLELIHGDLAVQLVACAFFHCPSACVGATWTVQAFYEWSTPSNT